MLLPFSTARVVGIHTSYSTERKEGGCGVCRPVPAGIDWWLRCDTVIDGDDSNEVTGNNNRVSGTGDRKIILYQVPFNRVSVTDGAQRYTRGT